MHRELHSVAADRGRLRDVVRDHGLSCLGRSRNGGEHRALRMALWNPCEVRREAGGHGLPWALERRGPEPAARKQHVELLLRCIEEEVVVGVRHLEDVCGGNRRQHGLAPEHDELRRDRAHVDGRDHPCLEPLPQFGRRIVEQIDLSALNGRLFSGF